jgi:hypothetical protein
MGAAACKREERGESEDNSNCASHFSITPKLHQCYQRNSKSASWEGKQSRSF